MESAEIERDRDRNRPMLDKNRRLLSTLALSAPLLMSAACGNSSGPEDPPPTATQTVTTDADDARPGPGATAEAAVRSYVEAFSNNDCALLDQVVDYDDYGVAGCSPNFNQGSPPVVISTLVETPVAPGVVEVDITFPNNAEGSDYDTADCELEVNEQEDGRWLIGGETCGVGYLTISGS